MTTSFCGGNRHLDFLRRLQPYHFGIPCADWLRVVMNRIGPDLFASCFLAFVGERLPEAVGQIAIDGKTSRRSHDRGRGQAALHLVSAYATTHSLVLGQLAVADKSNEITAIPLLLQELAASGALRAVSFPSTPWVANPTSPRRSSISAAIICWPPRTIRRPPMPRSSSISMPLRPWDRCAH
ncbi:MAG: ISAs1 family transposase [Mesorhizobium sp.]|uniref:ISAs1 family transposase n=1 Tax=unclassified Mesorhizobium TaxID=325217 RepID=UPI000F75F644|nr:MULTISPECIES: ISAs1 family transposase [unclassified Mesorhizobium]AZO19501.1 ISAs1 family transposase [Mesorhizobium sp. M1E.F.Ca.ET.045.02.1.1]RWB62802.1 MAG: ISAs1 family transposase [Mesorhizobium sp.]RWJ43579.1 MAG: ISAs1 family transposase [Mesorhizobium sp.]RWJ79356.1 MAG: ISAs1 family transposase [Mesorhizobium sp.]TGQ36894.1 ISAs1 family transposase [Mesorhizobium sp. M00.F.Ca.ET.216.01.1.1]